LVWTRTKLQVFPKTTPPPALQNTQDETITNRSVFSTSACGFSTIRAPMGSAKRMKSHKKNVEEITFERQNFI
jgi:hypothetical protein